MRISGKKNNHDSSDKLSPKSVDWRSLPNTIRRISRIGEQPSGLFSRPNNGSSSARNVLLELVQSKERMKIRFKTSTQVWKVVGVTLLVCGLQLYGQQRASARRLRRKPPPTPRSITRAPHTSNPRPSTRRKQLRVLL
jgi:hypothetical protein